MSIKKQGKSAIKVIAFVVVLCLIVSGMNAVLKSKHSHRIEPMEVFYTQQEDSIDVLFLGSSQVFFDVNTGILWDEFGIASYDLGGSVQPLWNTYYYLKEALKTQHPRLVVIDVYRTVEELDWLNHAQVYANTFGLRMSPDKVEAILASTKQKADYLLGMPVYHSRYAGLSKQDFLNYRATKDRESWKGFLPKFDERVQKSNPVFGSIDERENMTEKVESYLRKIIELLQDEGIPLLLLSAPYAISDEEQAVLNTVADIAEEYDVPYLRQGQYFDQIGLDFTGEQSDLSDNIHLNVRGAKKYTQYLGEYIKGNYDIPDRRGEEGYESWQTDADNIRARIDDDEIANITDLADWLERVLSSDRFTLVMNFPYEFFQEEESDSIMSTLKWRGLKLTGEVLQDGLIVVIQNGAVVASSSDPDFLWHDSLFSDELMVRGCGADAIAHLGYAKYDMGEGLASALLYDDLTGLLVEVSEWSNSSFDSKESMKA